MPKVWKAVSLSEVRVQRSIGGFHVARVLLGIKIFPSDITVDLNLLKRKIEENLPEYVSVHRFGEEPIAFGLSALIVYVSIPEERSQGLNDVEECLRRIDGVSQIETLLVHRM